MTELINVLGVVMGGTLPALAWLWFWLREDAAHPEPRRLIALAFFSGAVAVAFVIPIEKFVAPYLSEGTLFASMFPIIAGTTAIFIAWSCIEEIIKYLAAYWSVLRRPENDEPIDAVIYMVTVALGFAAAENTLFLLSPLSGDTVMQTILTGNFRFIGATLLHVLASSVIGVALALSFYKSRRMKILYTAYGVILAAILHAMFNFLILNTAEEHLLKTFGLVWIGIVALLAVLEYIKRIHPMIRRRFLR